MAGQAARRDFAGLSHVLFSHPPLVRFPIANRLGFVFRLRSVNHALQIRPGREAVFRCEPAAGRRFPPVLDGAGEPPVAGGVLPPIWGGDDANAVGGAAGEK